MSTHEGRSGTAGPIAAAADGVTTGSSAAAPGTAMGSAGPGTIAAVGPAGTIDQFVDFLVTDYWIGVGTAPHSFDTSASNRITVDVTTLGADGLRLARAAMEAWEAVVDIDFVEVASGAQVVVTDTGNTATAGYTYTGNTTLSATVNVGQGWLNAYGDDYDDYGLQTYLHEFGHVLGLGHPGHYGGGSASFAREAEFANDSWQTSVMSYFSQTDNPNVQASRAIAITPMIADIAAVQSIYGIPDAQSATAGNTTWGVGQTLGGIKGQIFDLLTGGPDPQNLWGNGAVTFTIYDRDGIDTLDVSTDTRSQHIDLRAEATSNIYGVTGGMVIARGTQIENASAGQRDDTVIGNDAANVLWGNGGNDNLRGNDGDDSLFGGDGRDDLRGGTGDDLLRGDGGDDEMWGEDGEDVLAGGSGDDKLRGGANDDLLRGDGGDDTLWGDGGLDVLIGGAGSDVLLGGPGADLLIGEDRDPAVDGLAAKIYRLYRATLDREPDAPGFAGWMGRLVSGDMDLTNAAAAFVNSREFKSTYGATSDVDFVTLLYHNVLDRAPDAAGLAGWLADLRGGMSRADVVLGFSNSPEMIDATANHVLAWGGAGIEARYSDEVFRLYQATLDRAPDVAGFRHWAQKLGEGWDYTDVAAGFVNSTEFQSVYGRTTNAQFVQLLYDNVLGRPADAVGLAHWTGKLAGGKTRADVVRGFAESDEFRENSEADMVAWMRDTGFNDRLVIDGADVAAGGAGADAFVFDQAKGKATAVIADVEAWDVIELKNTTFATAQAAASAVRDTADGAVLKDGALLIRFLGVDADTFDADQFILS